MKRTSDRPIPSGRIPPRGALIFAIVLMILGISALAVIGPVPAALGLFAVAWYNGFYTSLKKTSAFAAVPGALAGALPPVIGWIAAGGAWNDVRLYGLCLILAVWQVPHFWLVALERGEEYRAAGFPEITSALAAGQVRRLISHWALGTAAGSLLLSAGSVIQAPVTRFALAGLSLWLVAQTALFLKDPLRPGAVMFKRLNQYMGAFLLLCCSDPLLATLGIF